MGPREEMREGTQRGFKEGTAKVRATAEKRKRGGEIHLVPLLIHFIIWCFKSTRICSCMNTPTLCVHARTCLLGLAAEALLLKLWAET